MMVTNDSETWRGKRDLLPLLVRETKIWGASRQEANNQKQRNAAVSLSVAWGENNRWWWWWWWRRIQCRNGNGNIIAIFALQLVLPPIGGKQN
jgi:hypothetical protein